MAFKDTALPDWADRLLTLFEKAGRFIGEALAVVLILALSFMVLLVSPLYYAASRLWKSFLLEYFNTTDHGRSFTLLSVGACGLFALVYWEAFQISALAVGPLMAVLGAAILYMIMRFGLGRSFYDHIQNGNKAAGTVVLAFGIVIGLAILGALLGGIF